MSRREMPLAELYRSSVEAIPWQVEKRNDTEDYGERIKLDVWYIQNCSPWLDMKIIAETAWRVIRPNGAY